MSTQGPSVPVLAARARALHLAAEALRAAHREPATQALVAEAATNLQEAQRWFDDPRLEGTGDLRLWVDAMLDVTARRLTTLERALRQDC